MGFFDLLNPIFSGIDNYALGWLPAWVRVSLWGILSGLLTMLVYAKVSNQEALSEGKVASKKALVAMRELDPEADFDVAMKTMRNAIAAPCRQAKNSLMPALVASIPLIFILVWLDSAYSISPPAAGNSIEATTKPYIALRETETIQKSGEQAYALGWPNSGDIQLQGQAGEFSLSVPSSTPVQIIHKRQWWNALLGNPAGYLDDSAPIESIEFAHASRELINSGPGWIRSWLFYYFVFLMATAIAIKVRFKIA